MYLGQENTSTSRFANASGKRIWQCASILDGGLCLIYIRTHFGGTKLYSLCVVDLTLKFVTRRALWGKIACNCIDQAFSSSR